MTLAEIKAYLETNKNQEDVKAYLEELGKVTLEGVKKFIKTDEGKKWLGKQNDSFFTKGLETWKSNNLQKLIDEGVKKANPGETPEQKRIRELEEKIAKNEADKKKTDLLNKALLVADEKKLPKDLVKYFLGEDEDSTKANLEQLETVLGTTIKAQIEEKLKSGYKPGDDGTGGGGESIGAKLAKQKSEAEKNTTESQKNYF